MASMLNNYFTAVFNVPAEVESVINNHCDANDETGSGNSTNSEHTLPNFDIHTEDVLKAIRRLKTSKIPGHDNMYPKILKETKSDIVDVFTSIFNLSLRQDLVPADWKAANINPILKKMNK